MALVNGTNYDHIDLQAAAGGDTTRHMLQDTQARAQISDLEIENALQEENIPNTTQAITFDSAGNVQSITHKDGSNNTVRTDVFTFAANSITETRTLSTGESLTIVTNLTTLETTITYAAA